MLAIYITVMVIMLCTVACVINIFKEENIIWPIIMVYCILINIVVLNYHIEQYCKQKIAIAQEIKTEKPTYTVEDLKGMTIEELSEITNEK